jgi:hypothetical protein
MFEAGMSSTCFTVRGELVYERNHVYLTGFSSLRNIHSVQNRTFQVN